MKLLNLYVKLSELEFFKKSCLPLASFLNGKTQCATAVGEEVCHQGRRVRHERKAHLVNQLVDAKARGTLTHFLKSSPDLDLLICDEWG